MTQTEKNPPAIGRPGFDSWVEKISWKRARQPSPELLPGESSWTEGPGGLQSVGLKESDTTERLSTAQQGFLPNRNTTLYRALPPTHTRTHTRPCYVLLHCNILLSQGSQSVVQAALGDHQSSSGRPKFKTIFIKRLRHYLPFKLSSCHEYTNYESSLKYLQIPHYN